MIIFLFTLLAIALTVTAVGLLLSFRRESEASDISYAGRANRNGRVRQVYNDQVYGGRTTRRWRSSREYERPAGAGMLAALDVRNIFAPRAGTLQTPVAIALVSLTFCLIGFLLFTNMLPNAALIVNSSWTQITQPAPTPVAKPAPPKVEFPGVIGVSQVLKPVSQLDPKQYASTAEFNTWAYSACSAAAMTIVINAHNEYYRTGRQYRITDILKVEAELKEISPQLGLLRPTGIDRTVAKFNFQTKWLNRPSLNEVIKIANSGRPIIINFPPDRWAGGHLLVLRGGDSKQVFLADSSSYNMTKMSHADFLKYWVGFAAVVTPKGL